MARKFSRLTRAATNQLQPGSTITEHGITFARDAKGDGVFSVNIMVDGARIHRVVGRESDGTTRTHAEQFIEEQRSNARNDRLSLPKGRKLAMSFRAAAITYLERLAATDGKDLRMKRQRLHSHLIPFFGDTPLSKISPLDIERYKHQRAKEAVEVKPRGKTIVRGEGKATQTKPATINRELAVLSHLFNMAIDWGWIDRRPSRIKRLTESQGRITYLTVEQVARLIECAKQDQNPQVYPFIVIGVETSMRRMEILSIRHENIDVERRIIFIPKAKAGAREQPITARLATFLRDWMEATGYESPWLFPSPTAKSGHAMDIRIPFRRVVTAAGLDPDLVVRHTLRHTAITHLVQAGIDLPTVKRISGHKTLAMVERYAHQNGAHLSAAMDMLEARLKRAS
jgi:integrase